MVRDIARHLRVDPRMIRHNVIKLGRKYVEVDIALTSISLKDMVTIKGDYSIRKTG